MRDAASRLSKSLIVGIPIILLILTQAVFPILRAAPTSPTLPAGIVNSVPITITNTQAADTPAPFQQMITIDSSQFSSSEASNLQNIEFFYKDGTIIPSWLESGNSNSATNTVYWLNLASGVAASTPLTIYVGFAATTTNLFNTQTTGEAPQLSPTYAQYDSGAHVFNFYDNFVGNTLSAAWGNKGCNSFNRCGTYNVNYGLTMTASGGSWVDLETLATYQYPQVSEASIAFSTGLGGIIVEETTSTNQPPTGCTGSYDQGYQSGIDTAGGSGQYEFLDICGTTNRPVASGTLSPTFPTVIGLAWTSTGHEYATEKSTGWTGSATDATFSIANYHIAIGGGSGASFSFTSNWVRTRSYPPNGMMPLASMGTVLPSGIITDVPIAITNNQASPTPAPFQQMLSLDSSSLSTLEASNLQNIEFFTASGTVIPSWLESGNSNTATNTIYWLKLSNSIPAFGTITVFMGFAFQATNLFDGVTVGEAPQLSAPYAQYDNGVNVFNYYCNWAGSSLCSGWQNGNGGPVTVSNGLTLSSTAEIIDSNSMTYPQVFDTTVVAVNVPGATTPSIKLGLATSASAPNQYGDVAPSYFMNRGFLIGHTGGVTYANVCTPASTPTFAAFPSPYVQTIGWSSTGRQIGGWNYANQCAAVDTSIGIAPLYLWLTSSDGGSWTTDWVRARSYPPGGIMPSSTGNAPGKVSPAITATVTPSSIATGGQARDVAFIVGGNNPSATAALTYKVYSDPTCTGAPVFTDTENLGIPSTLFRPRAEGTYQWVVQYNGDANNNVVITQCGSQPLIVKNLVGILNTVSGLTTIDAKPPVIPPPNAGDPYKPGQCPSNPPEFALGIPAGGFRTCFTIQQNFFVYEPQLTSATYWGQNVVEVGIDPVGNHYTASQFSVQDLTGALCPAPDHFCKSTFPIFENAPASFSFMSTLSNNQLVMTNDHSSYVFPPFPNTIPAGSYIDTNTNICDTSFPLPTDESPQLDFVGPPAGQQVEFSSGSGTLTSLVSFDTVQWLPDVIQQSVTPAGCVFTAERSSGIAWSPDSTDNAAAFTSTISCLANPGTCQEGVGYYPAPTALQSTTTTSTIQNGATSANHTPTTGISVTVSSTSLPNFTPTTITTSQLSGPPTNVPSAPLDVSYYYVSIKGIQSGIARVCATNRAVTLNSVIDYWTGATWLAATNESVLGNVLCGDIPVSALNGTTVAIGLPAQISVSKFFTDGDSNLLPTDSSGHPTVDVVLSNGKVRSTNPGEVLAWVNVANTGKTPLQSLQLNDTLPTDWSIHPASPATGAVQVFFVYTNTTRLDITNQTSITTTANNPETVNLTIGNINATTPGTSLQPGESILLSVKLQYGLKGNSQTPPSYPRTYTDNTNATAWTQSSYNGGQATSTGTASFKAYAKVLGDVDGDFTVDITDVAIVAYAYGSTPSSPNWNPIADMNNDGVIDIQDIAIVAYYYGNHA